MQAGGRLGEYVLQERLGEGGFGEVWRAENPDLPGTVVAIKVPTKADCAAALRREGALQNVVDHPNVVRTLSVNTANDPPYLVSEFVAGESLRRRLDRMRRLAPQDAIEILRQVLSALEAAHRAGVVHRDVKPENVLLGPHGVAKLSDFGLGRITESVASSIAFSRGRSLTESGGIVGTYHYMSPEQMKGQPADLRTDLYACGVMLYEMLTGEAHPIRIPVEGVTRPMSDVVDRAVRTDPARRFDTAAEMATALQAASLPPHAHLAPPRERRPRSALFPQAATSSFVILAGCLVAVVIGVAVMASARHTRMREEAAARDQAMREMAAAHEDDFPVVREPGDLDAPLLPPFPGGGPEPAWISRFHEAEKWIAIDEFGQAEEELRRAIQGAGAGADCNQDSIPYLREVYYNLARADANLARGVRSSRTSSPPLDQFQAAAFRDSAFIALERAVELGFRDRDRMQSEADLASLKTDPRWNGIVNRMRR